MCTCSARREFKNAETLRKTRKKIAKKTRKKRGCGIAIFPGDRTPHFPSGLKWTFVRKWSSHAKFRDRVGTGRNGAKMDGLVGEIVSLRAYLQSVMKASYVMKAARHALTHNHSCILLLRGQPTHKFHMAFN